VESSERTIVVNLGMVRADDSRHTTLKKAIDLAERYEFLAAESGGG